jgi:hypothetical protein
LGSSSCHSAPRAFNLYTAISYLVVVEWLIYGVTLVGRVA